MLRHAVIGMLGLGLLAGGGPAAEPQPAAAVKTIEQLREQRKELAHRRRVMYNDDGCDCLYFSPKQKPTVENFLAQRIARLPGTHVTTIAYCSITSGFSNSTHRTRVGTTLTADCSEPGIPAGLRNIAQDLINQGTDCLQAVTEYGRSHGLEVFWSMRMNDTHDAVDRPGAPCAAFPKLKRDHPEWLVGNVRDWTPYGRWSSVDYARPEIRDLAFRLIEEVCRNYDVDGVEMDFFRHLCYFKSVALGGKARPWEIEAMTELLRRVRAMTEEVGLKRGRPLLLTVRVPDSVEFCRDMGFDLPRWLGEGMVDFFSTTCYFQLNPWEYTIELGHKYGVPAYPCLSDPRVGGETRFVRRSVECYRGRALSAWAAGADGINLFNLAEITAASEPLCRDVGDPQVLQARDQLYFVTVREPRPTAWLAGGSRYNNLPTLTPSRPRSVPEGAPLSLPIRVGADLAAASRVAVPQVSCHLAMPYLADAAHASVTFNGRPLSGGKLAAGWLDFPVDPAWVVKGINRVEVSVARSPASAARPWRIVCRGDKEPGSPWTRERSAAESQARVADAALLTTAGGKPPDCVMAYHHPWLADPAGGTVTEARVQVLSGVSRIGISNGLTHECLALWPNRIQLQNRPAVRHMMDTTDGLHVYRLVTRGEDIQVYVDGRMQLDAPGTFVAESPGRNGVFFGSGDGDNAGSARWEFVHANVDDQVCQDLVVRVAYPNKGLPSK